MEAPTHHVSQCAYDAYSYPLLPPRLRINSVSRPQRFSESSFVVLLRHGNPWPRRRCLRITVPGSIVLKSLISDDQERGEKRRVQMEGRSVPRLSAGHNKVSSLEHVQPAKMWAAKPANITRVAGIHSYSPPTSQSVTHGAPTPFPSLCSVHLISDTSLPFTIPNFLVSLITAEIGSWASQCAVTRLSFAAGPWSAERVRPRRSAYSRRLASGSRHRALTATNANGRHPSCAGLN